MIKQHTFSNGQQMGKMYKAMQEHIKAGLHYETLFRLNRDERNAKIIKGLHIDTPFLTY